MNTFLKGFLSQPAYDYFNHIARIYSFAEAMDHYAKAYVSHPSPKREEYTSFLEGLRDYCCNPQSHAYASPLWAEAE